MLITQDYMYNQHHFVRSVSTCVSVVLFQVHGHNSSSETPSVGKGHPGRHCLYLEFGCGSCLPSLLLLNHQGSTSPNHLLRGVASYGRRPLHVRLTPPFNQTPH